MKLNSKSINFSVDTVLELTSLDGVNGDICILTDEDRGGTFIYDDTAVDNQGTVFGYWRRQYDGAVNVKWFGVSPSETASNNTTAIQAALNNSIFDNYYIPAGIYAITNIVMPQRGDITIKGDGIEKTILKSYAISGAALSIVGSPRTILEDLEISSDDTLFPDVGIRLTRVLNSLAGGGNKFIRVAISGKYNYGGLYMISSEVNSFIDCQIQVKAKFALLTGYRDYYLYNIFNDEINPSYWTNTNNHWIGGFIHNFPTTYNADNCNVYIEHAGDFFFDSVYLAGNSNIETIVKFKTQSLGGFTYGTTPTNNISFKNIRIEGYSSKYGFYFYNTSSSIKCIINGVVLENITIAETLTKALYVYDNSGTPTANTPIIKNMVLKNIASDDGLYIPHPVNLLAYNIQQTIDVPLLNWDLSAYSLKCSASLYNCNSINQESNQYNTKVISTSQQNDYCPVLGIAGMTTTKPATSFAVNTNAGGQYAYQSFAMTPLGAKFKANVAWGGVLNCYMDTANTWVERRYFSSSLTTGNEYTTSEIASAGKEHRVIYGYTSIPSITVPIGSIAYNASPASGGYVGWVYTATGWKTFGLIS